MVQLMQPCQQQCISLTPGLVLMERHWWQLRAAYGLTTLLLAASSILRSTKDLLLDVHLASRELFCWMEDCRKDCCVTLLVVIVWLNINCAYYINVVQFVLWSQTKWLWDRENTCVCAYVCVYVACVASVYFVVACHRLATVFIT